jgi:hypothetical protein
MNKQKAAHNESLCDLLIQNGQYNDWVITTAFYSAIHYVKHQIFPVTVNGRTYSNFDNYYSGEIQNRTRKTKHRALIDLVSTELSACYTSFKWLHDKCHNSRYNNHHVSGPLAQAARQHLTVVKNNCPKP